MAKSGRNHDEFDLHSLRLGGIDHAARGRRRRVGPSGSERKWRWSVSNRVIQRENGGGGPTTYKAYTRKNVPVEDSIRVSRELLK